MSSTLPKTMQAAAIDGFGGIERISMYTLPIPKVDAGDVLIRVEATGIASWDAVERDGQYDGVFGFESTFPYVLGWDGAGTVAAVGERVTRFAAGDRVYAASMPLPKGGFYAEYAVVAEDHVAHVPSRLTIEEAAAMPWDALTAVSGLDILDVKAGTTLMIFGASGGIGHMALQFAKHMGARVLAVVSGQDGVALAKQLGADAVVDGRREDIIAAARYFAPNGLDAALTTAGGETFNQALLALRDDAQVACPYGVMPEPQVPPGKHLFMYNGDRTPAGTARLNQLVDSFPFMVHLTRTFNSLDQVPAAHRVLQEHYIGKIALRVVREK